MSLLDSSVLDRIRGQLVLSASPPSITDVALALRDDGVLLDPESLLLEADRLHGEMSGAGLLTALLADPTVTDVLVTAPDRVWVDRGRGIERVDVTFADDLAVRRLAQRLAAACGRRLDDAAPFVDARLSDGTRVHAVLSPLAVSGTCVSLRVPRRRGFDLASLVACRSIPEQLVPWIHAVVRARLAVLITGGTGTGKTTWLSVLLDLVDPRERIVIVEDSAELVPEHPHVVRLEARPANIEGAGAITVRDLVRQALRMRPDRLVVGEVRGAEVVELLAALNTGHEGGYATVHANSAGDVPARLEALGRAAGLDREALHAQVAAGLDLVLHLERAPDGSRRLASLSVAQRSGALVEVVDALVIRDQSIHEGPGLDHLRSRLGAWAPKED